MSMKNSNNTIGNRTRDLQAWSAVHQPNAPPRAPKYQQLQKIYRQNTSTLEEQILPPWSISQPIPVAARPKEWVCSWSLPGIAGSNSAECCVLSRRGVCDGPIRCPEESYRVCVCVCVCVCACARARVCARVSEYDQIHPQWVGIKEVKNKKKKEVSHTFDSFSQMTCRQKLGMKCKVRFTQEAKIFLFPKELGPVWGSPTLLFSGCWGSYLGRKRAGKWLRQLISI